MRISMPLAGLDSSAERDKRNTLQRDEAEERAFRMLSEGELFYVDPSSDVHDAQSSSRHDHGHLGGVSLEVITRAIASGQMRKPESEGSGGDTEAVSRSSSQDTENSWQGRSSGSKSDKRSLADDTHGPLPLIDQRAPSLDGFNSNREMMDLPRLDEAGAMDYERGTREKSFSEPQLRRCAAHTGAVATSEDMEDWLFAWSNHHSHLQAVAGATRAAHSGDGSGIVESREDCGDPCSALVDRVQDVWARLVGRDPETGCGKWRVESMCRHWSSATSTKTFETFETDQETLKTMGVFPDTYTMHIARFRVVATVWGRHAEFEVRVKGGGRRWARWQRFSNFKLMSAFVEGDSSCSRAWRRVTMAQSRRRCLDRDYLASKCNLLEYFLQQVMFTMPTPALLIHFASHGTN